MNTGPKTNNEVKQGTILNVFYMYLILLYSISDIRKETGTIQATLLESQKLKTLDNKLTEKPTLNPEKVITEEDKKEIESEIPNNRIK